MSSETTSLTAFLPPWLCIAVWISLGYSMILYNKLILSSWNFNHPFFLILCHTVMATILTQIIARFAPPSLMSGVHEGKVKWNDFFIKIFPYVFCSCSSLVLSNKVYVYLSLGYIQMLKAIMPVPLLLMYFASGREKLSLLQLLIVITISFGVMLTSIGELHFSIVGFTIQISAVISDCLRVFLLDVVLKDLNLDSLSMLYYTAPTLSCLLIVGFFVFEYETFPFERLDGVFSVVLATSGIIAFSLNLSIFILVSNTSSLIMTLAGPIKDFLLIMTSVIFFQSPLSLIQVIPLETNKQTVILNFIMYVLIEENTQPEYSIIIEISVSMVVVVVVVVVACVTIKVVVVVKLFSRRITSCSPVISFKVLT